MTHIKRGARRGRNGAQERGGLRQTRVKRESLGKDEAEPAWKGVHAATVASLQVT
jgi:hypothetical protein